MAEQQLREEAERKQAEEEEARKSRPDDPEEEKEGDGDAEDEITAGFEGRGEEASLSQGNVRCAKC